MKRILLAAALVVGALVPTSPASAAPGDLTTYQRAADLLYLAGAPDGALLVSGRGVILRVAPDRSSYAVVAGTGEPCTPDCGQDGPARTTRIAPGELSLDPATGDLWFLEGPRVRRIRGGQITTVVNAAGTLCQPEATCGDGGPGAAAQTFLPVGLGVGPDGTAWFLDYGRLRRVAPDGTVSTRRMGNPRQRAALAVGAGGQVAVVAREGVHLLEGAGERTLPARGCAAPDPCGDGGDGPLGYAEVISAAFDRTGNLYLGDRIDRSVRRITPDGSVSRVAGTWTSCWMSPCPERGVADRTPIDDVLSVAVAGDDVYAFVDPSRRILRVEGGATSPGRPPQRYRFLAGDGGVFNFGWAPFHGSTGDIRLNQPIVAGAAAGPRGYWLVAADGGIFSFGDAAFHGSAVGRTVSGTAQPVVGMAATPSGRGYYVLERSGFVHAFGDAVHAGNGSANGSNRAVGIAADPDGDGYWIAYDDGTVIASAAPDRGSFPRPAAPFVGIAGTIGGYWAAGSDGRVYAFGSAGFHGDLGGRRLNRPIVGIVPTPTDRGYWLIASDGGVFSFGDAEFLGSMGGTRLNRPVVGTMPG